MNTIQLQEFVLTAAIQAGDFSMVKNLYLLFSGSLVPKVELQVVTEAVPEPKVAATVPSMSLKEKLNLHMTMAEQAEAPKTQEQEEAEYRDELVRSYTDEIDVILYSGYSNPSMTKLLAQMIGRIGLSKFKYVLSVGLSACDRNKIHDILPRSVTANTPP